MKDVEQYLTEETHLQVYPEEIKGPAKVQFEVDEMGRLVAKSDLAVVPFPRDGNFTFKKVTGLKPDRTYTIAVKMLKQPYPGMVPLVEENAESFNFTLPLEGKASHAGKRTMDFSKDKLIVPLP